MNLSSNLNRFTQTLNRWAQDKRVLYALFLAAVATRLIGAYLGGTRAEDDDHWHYQIAMNFLQGNGLMLMTEFGPTYSYIQPGFAFIHILFMKLFSNFYFAERVFLLFMSSATIIIFFLLAKKLFSPACALVGTVIFILYPPQWFWMTRLNPHAFATNILVFCFFLLFVAWERRRWSFLFMTGLLWGVLTLMRPEYELGVAALAFAGLFVFKSWSKKILQGILLALGVLCILGPWAYRNYRIHGYPVLSTTHYGINFWMVFNPNYHYEVENLTPPDSFTEILMKEPNEVKRARLYVEEAKTYIRNNPKDAVQKVFGNFFRYWRPWLSPRVTPIFENIVYVTSYLPIFLLFLFSLFHIPWRDPRWMAIVLFMTYKVVAHVPFYMIVRFREATMPLMLLIAMLGIQKGLSSVENR